MCVSFLDEYLLNHERTERPPLRTIRTEPTLAPPGCGAKSYICYIFPDSLCTAHTVCDSKSQTQPLGAAAPSSTSASAWKVMGLISRPSKPEASRRRLSSARA